MVSTYANTYVYIFALFWKKISISNFFPIFIEFFNEKKVY